MKAIYWPDFTFRWFAHRWGAGDMGHWQGYGLMPNDHPTKIPGPHFIAAIDTRKPWAKPDLMEIDGALAYNLITQRGGG